MAAYFEFEQPSPEGAPRTFVFAVASGETDRIRAILRSGETDRLHVQGTIVPERAAYNPGWSFHLDPATVRVFELSIEVCDADVQYVEDNLAEIGGSLLPGKHWCPWSSKIVREVKCSPEA